MFLKRIAGHAVAVATCCLIVTGCASTGEKWNENQALCAVIGGVVGGALGAAAGERGDNDETEQIVTGGAIGGAAGAGLGYWLCGAKETSNQAPTARATASPMTGDAPLEVKLWGVGNDSDGQITSFSWDLGDGNTASGASVTHVYAAAGDYMAMLTVTDDAGLSDSVSVPIHVVGARAAEPVPTGHRMVLRGVTFKLNSAEIQPDAQVVLQAAAEVLEEHANVPVAIIGHTDSTGSEAYNRRLSERRAKAVRDYLISLGVDASRLSASGAGELEPVADNATADGRAQNRRVELNAVQ